MLHPNPWFWLQSPDCNVPRDWEPEIVQVSPLERWVSKSMVWGGWRRGLGL